MADEMENALKSIATQITNYVKDAATLSVETKFVTVEADGAANFDQARPAARTIIKLDGDSEAVVPVQKGETGLVVDRALFELHERNVGTAIEYRTRVLNALLTMLQGH
jgi:hypothetical protein